jgi:hypothetical protein
LVSKIGQKVKNKTAGVVLEKILKKQAKIWIISALLVGVGLPTFLASQQTGQAQGQSSPELQPPKTKLPLGTKRGLKELKNLLDSSEPTNSPSIRRVIIYIPKSLPKHFHQTQAGSRAISEFFLIAEANSLNLKPLNADYPPNLESAEGRKGLLSNGGTIGLRVRKVIERNCEISVGEIHLTNHQIAGYEKVRQIDLVTQLE